MFKLLSKTPLRVFVSALIAVVVTNILVWYVIIPVDPCANTGSECLDSRPLLVLLVFPIANTIIYILLSLVLEKIYRKVIFFIMATIIALVATAIILWINIFVVGFIVDRIIDFIRTQGTGAFTSPLRDWGNRLAISLGVILHTVLFSALFVWLEGCFSTRLNIAIPKSPNNLA